MKKVLFVTSYFAPDNTIAAIRTTKLTKYMIKNGYYVDVVSVKNHNLSKDETLLKDIDDISIKYADNSEAYHSISKCINKIFGPIREKKYKDLSNRRKLNSKSGMIEFYPFETAHPWIASVFYLLSILRDYDLYKGIRKEIDNLDSYDYMITSYGDKFCYFFGKKYHKLHPETKWVFDIRDSIYRYKFVPGPVGAIPRHIEKVVWKNADIITGVSEGICMRVDNIYKSKVYLVTNGYDIGDRPSSKVETDRDKVTFTFTGSLYGGLMDLSVFFKALRELINSKLIVEDKIQIVFAGTKSASDVFVSQAEKSNVEHLIIDHGKVDRYLSLKLQEKSDVLLCPSYDFEEGKGGVITGKIFEYMTAKRPVIAVITGSIQHSELADIVRNTNIGFAYEESHDAEDFPKLCQYILKIYQDKFSQGYLNYAPNQDEIEKYDYRNLAKRFIAIMDPEFDIV